MKYNLYEKTQFYQYHFIYTERARQLLWPTIGDVSLGPNHDLLYMHVMSNGNQCTN